MSIPTSAKKPLAILLAAFAIGAFAAPQAHAASVQKAAGQYKGSGTFVDHRVPTATYTYTFSNVIVNVSKKGKLSGSADISLTYSFNGVPSAFPQTSSVTVSGKVTDLKITKSKITATGQLVFSDGTTVDGDFSVNAKTGKGTIKVNFSDSQFDAKFKLKK